MKESFPSGLGAMRVGILFSLLTLLYGFGLGALFGVAEDSLKGHLKDGGESYLAALPDGDREAARSKVDKTVDKSWTYLKRAHLHANGLGTASLAMILLLGSIPAAAAARRWTALALGTGSFGYALFWMLAGLRAPGLGSTGAAKETLKWLAVPSTTMLVGGLLLVIVLLIRGAFASAKTGSD